MSIHALRSSSILTLEILNRDKYRTMCLRVEWQKQEIVLDWIKILEFAFTVVGIDDVAIIHEVGRSEFRVSVLKA